MPVKATWLTTLGSEQTEVVVRVKGITWIAALWPVLLIPKIGQVPIDIQANSDHQQSAYENEPTGFIPLVELNFDEYGESGWDDLSSDPEFEIARASAFVPEKSGLGRIQSPPLTDDDWIGVAKFFPYQEYGTAPFNFVLPPDSAWNSRQLNELFWGYWIMVSENHTVVGGNKIGFIEIGDIAASTGGSQIYFGLAGPAEGARDSFNYAVFNQGHPTEIFNGRWTCSGGRVIKAGQWHKIEHYAKLNTLSDQDSVMANGIHRVWVDGRLCVNTDTVRFIGHPHENGAHLSFSRVKWRPTYKAPSPPDTSYQFMSHLYVSGKRSN